MRGTKQGGRTSDEGDGDLGLQGLSMDTSPPLGSTPLDSAAERGASIQVIKSRFGSNRAAKTSSSSFGSSSYLSARDEKSFDSPSAGRLPANGSEAASSKPSAASSDAVESPSKARGSSRKSSGKAKKRFSILRTEAGGLLSERPLAGGIGGPALSPRSTSTAGSKARKQGSKSEAGRPSSSNNGDLSGQSPKLEPLALTGGTSSTGLLVGNPVLASPSSPTHPAGSTVPIPGRRTSLVLDRSRRTSKEKARDPAPADSASRGARSGLFEDARADSADSAAREASLQRWVLSVGCVNFDLDKGPDLEFLYPSLGISREERDNIAFSSFPDTSIFDDGQAVFSWRVREVPLDSSGSEAPVIASPSPSSSLAPTTSMKSAGLQRPSSGEKKKPTAAGAANASSVGHRLWTFDRAWMHTGRGPSSDISDPLAQATAASNGSSRSGSPLPERVKKGEGERIMPPPVQRKSSSLTLEKVASNESRSSAASDNGDTVSASATEEGRAKVPKSAPPAIESLPVTADGLLRTAKNSTSSNYIHGYCFFRQKRDASIRRGYFQKSVIILSHLPYVSLFSEIVKKLGPLYFSSGMPALEAFSQDIQNWPPPEPGARLHLPLLGSVLSVDLPYHSQFQTSNTAEARITQNTSTLGKSKSGLHIRAESGRAVDKGSGEEPILASIPSTPLFDIFRESLDHLWLLWECLLLAEPLLVIGPDPRICSEAVWHLIDLIRPIPFAGDFRPFFTIHDYDFATLVTKNKPGAGVILGVTNPFMLQACKHWPHVFKVGKAAVRTSSAGARTASRKNAGSSASTGGQASGAGGGGIAGGNSAGGGGPEHMPGLLSKRKRRISKDRPLLRKLTEMAEKGTDDEAANAMLRRYFSDLTERFLAPLNRYVSSLIPAEFDLSSPLETPRIKPFNTTAFLASLKAHGTPLPIRSRNLPTGTAVRQSLYLEFLQCPNFSLWLHDRIAQSEEEQYNRRLKALESGNINDFVSNKSELETIDLYSRLTTEIAHIDDKLMASKRERELEPNSRWKSPTTTPAPLRDSFPALALSNEPSTPSTAKKIEEMVRTSGNTLTSGEKALLVKKVHLIGQLDTLIKKLPADLRDSLHLTDRRGGGHGL